MKSVKYAIAAEIISSCCQKTIEQFQSTIDANGGLWRFKYILWQIAHGEKDGSSEFDVHKFLSIAAQNNELSKLHEFLLENECKAYPYK